MLEFKNFVSVLEEKGIEVIVIKDTMYPHTPDSIYPNNWVTFQRDGNVVLFPMYAQNRRLERREDIIEKLKQSFLIENVVDLSENENQGKFLEGTGSMIFDHDERIAYGCISKRLDLELFKEYCKRFNYKPVAFHAFQSVEEKRLPIYHTNVMMCVAKDFVTICLDSIDDEKERELVMGTISGSGKQILDISEEQMHHFAGNMLQVKNKDEKLFTIMSKLAFGSLNKDQIDFVKEHSEIIYADLSTIEKNGGGSARCMLAEVFLKKLG